AHEIYGVVFDTDGRVDPAATRSRRAELKAGRAWLRVVPCETDAYVASGPSRKRVCRLNPRDADAFGLAPDQAIELLADDGAPLRAWLRLDGAVAPGTVPLDEIGRRTLDARDGSIIQIRPLLLSGAGK
ncbi:MAG: hypothetical protein O7H40_17375, partial [Gammaproteobacteria bacterium]|nr:hypothetical protein [Gammaproteobacteria bacterium]